MSSDKEHFILNVKEERLKSAPGFDKDKWPDMSRPERAAVVYQFYDLVTNSPKAAAHSAEVSQTMKGEVGLDF